MNYPQACITLFDCIYHYPDCSKIKKIFIRNFSGDFLPINTVKMLASSVHFSFYFCFVQQLFDWLDNRFEIFIAIISFLFYYFYNFLIFFGMKIFQAQIFKFPFNFCNTKPVYQRNINIQGFLSNTFYFGFFQMFDGSHVMQSICKFYENYTNILGYRNQ